jgi:hypothetical protein
MQCIGLRSRQPDAKISGGGIENDDDNESEEVKQLWDSAASSVIEAIEDGDDSNDND